MLSLCASGRFVPQGQTSYKAVMDYTSDISEYASFLLFQWCYFYDKNLMSNHLWRWIGSLDGVVQLFCSYIILSPRDFISRSSVVGIEDCKLTSEHLKEECRKFMDSTDSNIGNIKRPLYDGIRPDNIYYSSFHYDTDYGDVVLPYGQ